MALQQCLGYLTKFPWKLIETDDTALSAKHIHQRKSKHVAAIASDLAAELFDLHLIAPKIHDVKDNYTRFLILQQDQEVVANANKASINFHTDHAQGSLAKVLTLIAKKGINLSKLQSFPIPGSRFNYGFHADLEFDHADQFNDVIKNITGVTKYIRVLGVYKKGKFNI
jgi:prephenate dehydratase